MFIYLISLQGRLEGYIDNPSAPEMLHHLFPPLAFLVDECYDLFDEDLVTLILKFGGHCLMF